MHPNETLIHKLYTCLDSKDHVGMASCYHQEATFRDIAFDLKGMKQIHAMWHMVAETDLRATFSNIQTDDKTGSADLVDVYTFRSTGNRVKNIIRSTFRFQDGLIIDHQDACNSWDWCMQALGPVAGFAAWLLPYKIRQKGTKLLNDFIEKHQEYR